MESSTSKNGKNGKIARTKGGRGIGAFGGIGTPDARQSGNRSGRRSTRAREQIAEGGEETLADSWVDALVTLLAIVVFGLGWGLVELARAEHLQDRYDAALLVAWSSAENPGAWSEGREPWTGALQERSRR